MPAKPPSIKQLNNEKALVLYAASLVILALVVSLTRWVLNICDRALQSESKSSKPRKRDSICRVVLSTSRKLEKQSKWRVPGLGQLPYNFLLLLVIFLLINTFFCLNIMDARPINIYASRFGWMATANMMLCVLFALRNAPLTSTSMPHADLKTIHIALGYISGILLVFHAICYTIFFGRQARWDELIEAGNIEGIGACVATVVLMFGILRHKKYELFIISHVLSYAFLLVMLGLHRPGWFRRPKLPLLVIIMSCMWILERLARAVRVAKNLVRGAGRVSVHPLPGGGVRLVLKIKGTPQHTSGAHCYLWIPQINWYQTHPFTIVDSDPQGVELVIKSQDGFTKKLYEYAQASQDLKSSPQGREIWASIDGPYGSSSLPDTTRYDKLVLVAGGSGAAFTFGLMNRILNGDGFYNNNRRAVQSIDFVWAVRKADMLTWFREHLVNLAASPNVNVTVYITGGQSEVTEVNSPSSLIQRDMVLVDDVEAGEMECLLGHRQHLHRYNQSNSFRQPPHHSSINYIYTKMDTTLSYKKQCR